MRLTTPIAAIILAATLLLSTPGHADPADDSDVFALIAPIFVLLCDPDKIETCSNRIACLRSDGLWENDVCSAKPTYRIFTEFLAGKWSLLTIFPEGNNKSYFWFDINSVQQVNDSEEYSIEGGAHLTSAYNTPNPVYIVGAYDATEEDWFMLELWGQSVASLYEFEFTSPGSIRGCEYFVSYPDLRFLTGTCNAFSGSQATSSVLASTSAGDTVEPDKRTAYQNEMARVSRQEGASESKAKLSAVSARLRAALLNRINNN